MAIAYKAHWATVHITARADYAVRAVVELASRPGGNATAAQIAEAQEVPGKFLEAILADLRRAKLLEAQRGSGGGYRLALPPAQMSLADVVRAVEGPLAAVRGLPPEDLHYAGAATGLTRVWVAVRAALRAVLEEVTVADVLADRMPASVEALLAQPEAWERR